MSSLGCLIFAVQKKVRAYGDADGSKDEDNGRRQKVDRRCSFTCTLAAIRPPLRRKVFVLFGIDEEVGVCPKLEIKVQQVEDEQNGS